MLSDMDATYPSVEDWLTTKAIEGRSKRTCTAYLQTVRQFSEFLGRDPVDATTRDVRAWFSSLGDTCSNVTINNYRRILNSYYQFLEDEDEIDKSPMRRIRYIKEDRLVKKAFSDEEMERILASANTPRDHAVVSFLASTGCRVGELVGVKRDNVDMTEREVKVYGKGGKERIVYFDAKCKLAVEEYLSTRTDESPYLFVSRYGGKQLTTGAIERIVRNVGERADVENCHPHRFRRTVATRAINRGMPIEQVKELLGHSNIQTTMIYAMVSRENVKAAHRRYLQ